ncbi:MAG TPA: TVP38/TMEM64 family protein, partial [Stellaceae bacterium]|nr:TVP38/TMEM64 family protein [Stellaceae bacterium]
PPSRLCMTSMPYETSPQHGISARRLIPLGLLVAAGITFVAVGGHHYLTFAALAENRDWLSSLVQRWGFVAAFLYIAVYALLVALSVPGSAVLTIAGGFLFGTWLGTLCAVLGATLGATGIFLATRAGLGGLARRAGPLVGKLEAGFRADAFNYLLVLRLVFIFPFWLVNLVPALAGVRLSTFILATFLGIIPGAFVYASLGNGLGNVVGEPGLGVLLRPSVLGPVVGLVILALIPVGYKRWRTKRPA